MTNTICLSKDQKNKPGVSAGSLNGSGMIGSGRGQISSAFMCMGIFIACGFLLSGIAAASYTLNISLSTSTANPSTFQQDLLTDLTVGRYLGISKASPFFANTYSVTVNGKNPNYQGPLVSTTLITLDSITQRLTDISSDTYAYGMANGMDYQKKIMLDGIGTFLQACSSAAYFNTSTTSWNQGVCTTTLMKLYDVLNP